MLKLAMAGLMVCSLKYNGINDTDRMCFYQCQDSTKEFASTNKQFQCPPKLYVERKPLKFKYRDFKANRWTKEQIEDMLNQ